MRNAGLLWQLTIAMAAIPASAQYTELAANGDGSQLFVVSSGVLRDATTPTRAATRLYRIGPDGVQLIVQREIISRDTFTSSFPRINGVASPRVSGDAQTIAYTVRGVCISDPCVIGAKAELIGASIVDLGPGKVQLSRNGRWAVLSSDGTFQTNRNPELIDLTTGQHTPIPQPDAQFAIASDGSVLVSSGGLGLWRDGQFTSLSLAEVGPLALSDNARVFVFLDVVVVGFFPRVQLKARDIATGHDTVLSDPGDFQEPLFMGMSDDGRRVLFRIPGTQSNGPAFLADTNTGHSTPLALPDGDLATAGTMSGDGSIAFIATTSGRILKFHANQPAPETLIPATPDVGHDKQFPVGSLVHLNGYLPGSADDLRGQILVDGRPVPVVKTNPNDVAIQIPWEQHTGDVPFRVDIPSGSPFITYELATVAPVNPAFEPLDPGETAIVPIKLIKGDFSGLITAEPQPGDIVIAYMTGLGPVQGQPQTETPAPLDVLMPLNGSITCTFHERQTSLVPPTPQGPAETLFAGLAPGLIGTYQVMFRMPAGSGQGPINSIGCDLTTAQGGGSLAVWFYGSTADSSFWPH